MRYFHRTSLKPEQVLAEADAFLGARVGGATSTERGRTFRGTVGALSVTVRAEGGHYTLVTVETDQVGESEADKLAKRLLALVHTRLEPAHALRGAY
ncbi:MAG TPA: hypothetical protein VGI83_06280 [Gemmatimonadales bacterium]|jgi:hypothetical protein